MKTALAKFSLTAVALAASLALVGCGHKCGANCNCAKTPASTALPPAIKAPGTATIGDKSVCPVSGEEFTITASSPKAEHEGKTYYFCCPGCDGKFAKSPAKYLSK